MATRRHHAVRLWLPGNFTWWIFYLDTSTARDRNDQLTWELKRELSRPQKSMSILMTAIYYLLRCSKNRFVYFYAAGCAHLAPIGSTTAAKYRAVSSRKVAQCMLSVSLTSFTWFTCCSITALVKKLKNNYKREEPPLKGKVVYWNNGV